MSKVTDCCSFIYTRILSTQIKDVCLTRPLLLQLWLVESKPFILIHSQPVYSPSSIRLLGDMNLQKHTHSESECALLNSDGISVNMFIAEIASPNCIINHFHDHCIPGGHFESVLRVFIRHKQQHSPGTINISLEKLSLEKGRAHGESSFLVSLRLKVADHFKSIFTVY